MSRCGPLMRNLRVIYFNNSSNSSNKQQLAGSKQWAISSKQKEAGGKRQVASYRARALCSVQCRSRRHLRRWHTSSLQSVSAVFNSADVLDISEVGAPQTSRERALCSTVSFTFQRGLKDPAKPGGWVGGCSGKKCTRVSHRPWVISYLGGMAKRNP